MSNNWKKLSKYARMVGVWCIATDDAWELFSWNDKLIEACWQGRTDMAILMIGKGANDWNGGLLVACWRNHKELASLMIEKGANNFNIALHHACGFGNKDMAILMIENGACIDLCTHKLDDIDIEYLLNKIKNFGKYTAVANLIKERRLLADGILKELVMIDVDTIIRAY